METHIARVSIMPVRQPQGAARQSPSDRAALGDGQAPKKGWSHSGAGRRLVWERIQAWVLQLYQPKRGRLAASRGPRLTKK